MQKVKRRPRVYSDKKAKKKHVESMFLTNKQKAFPFYFKDKKIWTRRENKLTKSLPIRYYYSLRVLESGYINLNPLKATMRLYKWFLKSNQIEEGLTLNLRVFPDFVLTSKPKEMRMGKGKGSPEKKVALVKAGAVLLSLKNWAVSDFLAKSLIAKISNRVPLKHEVVFNNW